MGELLLGEVVVDVDTVVGGAAEAVGEVEELVEPGAIDPDTVHLPGIFVQRVVALTPEQAADKRIERRTVTAPAARGTVNG